MKKVLGKVKRYGEVWNSNFSYDFSFKILNSFKIFGWPRVANKYTGHPLPPPIKSEFIFYLMTLGREGWQHMLGVPSE